MNENNDAIVIDQLLLKIPMLYKNLYHDASKHHCFVLPATQIRVLLCLLHQGVQTITDLSVHLTIQRQQLTKLIDALELKNLVVRKECKENKRTILIEMTPDGLAYVEDIIHEKSKLLSEFYHQLSPEDQASVLRTLQMIDIFLEKR